MAIDRIDTRFLNFKEENNYNKTLSIITKAENRCLIVESDGRVGYAGKMRQWFEQFKEKWFSYFGAMDHTKKEYVKEYVIAFLEFGKSQGWYTSEKIEKIRDSLPLFQSNRPQLSISGISDQEERAAPEMKSREKSDSVAREILVTNPRGDNEKDANEKEALEQPQSRVEGLENQQGRDDRDETLAQPSTPPTRTPPIASHEPLSVSVFISPESLHVSENTPLLATKTPEHLYPLVNRVKKEPNKRLNLCTIITGLAVVALGVLAASRGANLWTPSSDNGIPAVPVEVDKILLPLATKGIVFTPENIKEINRLYVESNAEPGTFTARLGNFFVSQAPRAKDVNQRIELYKQAGALQNAEAYFRLGGLYERVDKDEAIKYYELAVKYYVDELAVDYVLDMKQNYMKTAISSLASLQRDLHENDTFRYQTQWNSLCNRALDLPRIPNVSSDYVKWQEDYYKLKSQESELGQIDMAKLSDEDLKNMTKKQLRKLGEKIRDCTQEQCSIIFNHLRLPSDAAGMLALFAVEDIVHLVYEGKLAGEALKFLPDDAKKALDFRKLTVEQKIAIYEKSLSDEYNGLKEYGGFKTVSIDDLNDSLVSGEFHKFKSLHSKLFDDKQLQELKVEKLSSYGQFWQIYLRPNNNKIHLLSADQLRAARDAKVISNEDIEKDATAAQKAALGLPSRKKSGTS